MIVYDCDCVYVKFKQIICLVQLNGQTSNKSNQCALLERPTNKQSYWIGLSTNRPETSLARTHNKQTRVFTGQAPQQASKLDSLIDDWAGVPYRTDTPVKRLESLIDE